MPPTAPCCLLAFRSLSNPLPSHRAGPKTRFLPGESSFLRLEALNGRCRKDLGGQEPLVSQEEESEVPEGPHPCRGAQRQVGPRVRPPSFPGGPGPGAGVGGRGATASGLLRWQPP